jgi:hypothetical protein
MSFVYDQKEILNNDFFDQTDYNLYLVSIAFDGSSFSG